MLKPLAHRERRRPSGASVLVVDDDPQVRDLLRALLEGRGDRPLPAGNVSEAREALTQHEVHLVLCDVDMPGRSGLEVRTPERRCAAAVGLTEEQAREAGHDVKTSVLRLEAVPRAIVNSETPAQLILDFPSRWKL